MAKVRRTVMLSETRGFLKALISAKNDEILGITAFGAEAGEVMSVVQTAHAREAAIHLATRCHFGHPSMARGSHSLVFRGAGPIECPYDTMPAGTGIQKLLPLNGTSATRSPWNVSGVKMAIKQQKSRVITVNTSSEKTLAQGSCAPQFQSRFHRGANSMALYAPRLK